MPDSIATQSVSLRIEVMATGLEAPVAMAFLPDGRAILAERSAGSWSLFDPATGEMVPIQNPPPALVQGDGGPLDVVLHPDHARNGWIYLAYSAADGDSASVTALDRVRLNGTAFTEREELFRAAPGVESPAHFGGRIAFHDGFVFLSVGDREPRAEPGRLLAQSLETYTGTIVRLADDGGVPQGNPFLNTPGALPEIWSYGHRNPQGMAVNPWTGTLWAHEHGPQGGDEVNLILRGRNYGWPVVTYGEEYGGGAVGDGAARGEGFTQPIHIYRPSIAPSDMVFPTGPEFPEWHHTVLIGAMGLRHLNLLTLDGDRVLHEERILTEQAWRIRMIEADPQGRIYLGTDSGLLLRLSRRHPLPGG